MAEIKWDQVGERKYETGVDHGVLYLPNSSGEYVDGVAWNGLVSVTQSPSGAEATAQYADNIKYLNLVSAEEYGATIEAFTYPDEFAQCDGTAQLAPGVLIGQQSRKTFGMSFRTLVGNDVDGTDHGYKLNLMYGALAAPTEKAYTTVNDSPEAITFSWEVTTTPVEVPGFKPTALLTIDSTQVPSAQLKALEDILYGTAGTDPRMPLPAEVMSIFSGGITEVTPQRPTQDGNVVTLPAVTGITYKIGSDTVSGTVTLTEDVIIRAVPDAGYTFTQPSDSDWLFEFDEG